MAQYFKFENVKTAMSRERKKYMPSLPKTLQQLGVTLQDLDLTRNIYLGTSLASDGSVHVMFGHQTHLALLNSATEIFVDGTFSVSVYGNDMLVKIIPCLQFFL